jgi:type IV secretion system protein TrbJ
LKRFAYALLLIASTLIATRQPSSAQFGGVVHDPLNAVHFLTQIQNQINQINQLTTQINNERQNLQTYSSRGLWTQLQQRLVNLRSQIQNAVNSAQIAGGVADAQIAQMNQEIGTVQSLENLANNSTGNLAAQQASARLQSELISQIAEERQLTLAQVKQVQLEEQEALQRYHNKAQNPSTY